MPPQQKSQDHSDFGYEHSSSKNPAIEVGESNVKAFGLERFIRNVAKSVNLHMEEKVEFNLNSRGILFTWKDIFEVESIYTKCLGLTERFYQCHGYTHNRERQVFYFILEEHNKRIWKILPEFDFHLIVFCYYNERSAITKVEIQYDQMSFFLHCLGLAQLHKSIVANLLTPFAQAWAKTFAATGFVNPITFLAQIIVVFWLIYRCIFQ
jgi:hypothetical protein